VFAFAPRLSFFDRDCSRLYLLQQSGRRRRALGRRRFGPLEQHAAALPVIAQRWNRACRSSAAFFFIKVA
jgi:hypothetical protein